MYIKELYNPREYDVFLGDGWENWVRVKYTSSNKIEVVNTSVEELEPSTLRLIYFKLKKLRRKAATANG